MEKNQKERLLNETLMINASLCWWESEMSKVLAGIEKLDQDPLVDYDSPEYVKLQGQLAYLLHKGRFELRVLTAFKKKIALLP